MNNASVLGPSPQPGLAEYPLEVLKLVYVVNTLAPPALFQAVLPQLARRGGRVVNVSSDAAVEAYAGWGGYGSAKAALDQLTAVLAGEHPQLRIYSFDPGDMATDLHQQAFPDEDMSDRPAPGSVVPALLPSPKPTCRADAIALPTSRQGWRRDDRRRPSDSHHARHAVHAAPRKRSDRATGASGSAVGAAYAAAVERRYLWHEFGDSTLFLPEESSSLGRRRTTAFHG